MTDDLKSLILRLEGRVTSLEGGKAPAAKPAAEVKRGVYFLKISPSRCIFSLYLPPLPFSSTVKSEQPQEIYRCH